MNFFAFSFELTDGSLMEGAAWGLTVSDAFDNLFNHEHGNELRFRMTTVEFEEVASFDPRIFLVTWQATICD